MTDDQHPPEPLTDDMTVPNPEVPPEEWEDEDVSPDPDEYAGALEARVRVPFYGTVAA